jgi:hypoxanthine phosphoribosyltransferase
MQNYFLSHEKFTQLAYKLLDEIKKTGHTYQAVLCPLRGGFFLSYFMSRHLNIPIRYLEISSYTGTEQKSFHIGNIPELQNGRFLLCDDIYDSGNTIRKIGEIFKGIEMDIAVVLTKKHLENFFYGEFVETDQWVDFYWEVL